MKKLLLLSALLIFTCSSGLFAQDYMKLSKKKLRIEHQKKVDLIDTLTMNIDTLNSLNRELKSNLLIAKTDLKKKNDFINDLKFKLIQNEKDTSRLEREIQMINDSILELKNKILQKKVSNPLDGLRNSSNFETFLSYFLLTTYSEKNIDSLIANSSPLVMKFTDSNIEFGRFYNQGVACRLYTTDDYGYNSFYGKKSPKLSNIFFYKNKTPIEGFCEEASSPDGVYYKQISTLPEDYDPIEIKDIPAPYYLRNLEKMEVNIQLNYFVVNTFYFVEYRNKWVLLYTNDCDCSS